MIATKENFPKFTPEEYFDWEEKQKCRHEYINGEVYAMTGGTLNHGRIAMNFGFILKAHLRGSGEYILVDSNSISIELFRKNDPNSWQIIDYQSGDLMELKSMNFTFLIG